MNARVGKETDSSAKNLAAYMQVFIKESKMSELSQQNTESSVIAENTSVSLDWGTGNKYRGRIASSALQKTHSLQKVNKKKILDIQQQLAEGTYDVEKHLDVALDRFLEKIIG
jgi:hypothetical protein